MSIIFTTITTDNEIEQLLDLQERNLTRNISDDVANTQGFDIPVITAMFGMLDSVEYRGKLIKDTQYYAMGQICVAEGYHGYGYF